MEIMLDTAVYKKSEETSIESGIDPPIIHEAISSMQRKKKRKRKKDNVQPENDKDILIENDRLVHKTDSVASSCSDQQVPTELMFLKDNPLHQIEKPKDTDSQSCQDIRKVALNLAIQKGLKNKEETISDKSVEHVDYVLVYSDEHNKNNNHASHSDLRKRFERKVELQGLALMKKKKEKLTFVIITCSFSKLCQEAEAVSLKMPLAGFEAPDGGPLPGFWKHFQTDDEVDLASAPFCVSKKELYDGIEDPDTFFRPSLRSLLVHHILINLNIREETNDGIWDHHRSSQGLAYMLMHGVYTDAVCVHTPSSLDPMFADVDEEESTGNSSFLSNVFKEKPCDPRKALDHTWLKWKKFQPLWKIRNYFGEKIALYFAWLGLLVSSLWIPMVIGVIVALWGFTNAFFIIIIFPNYLSYYLPCQLPMVIGVIVALWGFTNAIEEQKSGNNTLSVGETVQGWMRDSFDNDATPVFALIICLWGTLFLELWKRKNAELAYQWDVSDFEEQEPNRPQFYGTEIQKDPITGNDMWVYPLKKRFQKLAGSFSVLLFMVCLVIATTFGIIIYRVVSRVDIFDKNGSIGPTLASVTSSFLNTVCIMVMGKCYQRLAVILSDWENHRTQTSYEDALIVKLFGFQFVNSYASLYYIAFFRGSTTEKGVLDKGSEYSDSCGENNDCMTMLSLQVAMLMIMKPLPKLFSDSILPWLQHMWQRGLRRSCCCCCRNGRVHSSMDVSVEEFIESELEKTEVGDFTLSEYNEKVIQYGFLMLFATAFPLAPLIALVTNMFDLRIDAKRLLWTDRRPVAFRAEDIGTWYSILEFLNVVGVVTNSFLVAFTSQYGRNWEGGSTFVTVTQELFNSTTNATVIHQTITEHPSSRNRLWLIIGFEHIVFAVKFFIALVIPDVPSHVKMAERRGKYHVDLLLDKAGVSRGPRKKPSEVSSKKDNEMQTEPDDRYSEKAILDVVQSPSTLRPRRHKGRKTNENIPKRFNEITNETELEKPEHTDGIMPSKLAPLPLGYAPSLPTIDSSEV